MHTYILSDTKLILHNPKYSVIIPTYNGISYLPTCIQTIISQNYSDYELIISDDHSTDGTREYLEKLSHPNIKVIYPPQSLSMTEHWEWALKHAKGDWQIFVGQDDGLQAYFFQLADKLTLLATEKSLRTIMSSRAYFFWAGCDHTYGNKAIEYIAENKIKVHNFSCEASKVLFSLQDYFELPQMYTTALFHKDLLDEARKKQNGNVLCCHPQDANLAALAFSFEQQYLKSYIPLGWVGSSPKSAGMAINALITDTGKDNLRKQSEALKKDYLNKVSNSKLKYHSWAGDFSFGSNALYFWQALLMTQHLRPEKVNKRIKSLLFKIVFFARVLYSKKIRSSSNFQTHLFADILRINNLNKSVVFSLFYIFATFGRPIFFIYRIIRKLKTVLFNKKISLFVTWENQAEMLKASETVLRELKKYNWLR